MKLTTTLNLNKTHNCCHDGYHKLVTHLGGLKKYGADEPIDLVIILDCNGVGDCLWAFRATAEPSQHLARRIADEISASLLELYGTFSNSNEVREAMFFARGYAASATWTAYESGVTIWSRGTLAVSWPAESAKHARIIRAWLE